MSYSAAVPRAAPNSRSRWSDRPDPPFQPVAQLGQPTAVAELAGDLRGGAEADDTDDVLASRPPAALLTAAAHQRRQRHGGIDDERADAGRSAELVRRERQQMHAERAKSTVILPAACTASQCTSAPCRRAKATMSATGCSTPSRCWPASPRPAPARRMRRASPPAHRGGRCRRVSTGMISARSGACSTDACSTAETSTRRRPAPRSASAFASVPPPVNTTFAGSLADQFRDLLARIFDQASGEPSVPVHRGRIAQTLHRLAHRPDRLRAKRRRRVVVEVDARSHSSAARLRCVSAELSVPPRPPASSGGAPLNDHPAASENPSLADVGERHRAQIQVDLIAEFFPQIVGEAAAPVRMAAVAASPGCSGSP